MKKIIKSWVILNNLYDSGDTRTQRGYFWGLIIGFWWGVVINIIYFKILPL